jgi:hypothetical protein
MKIFSTFVICLFCCCMLKAHNPQISTIAIVQEKDNKWVMIVSSSFTAYEFEIKNSYPTMKMDSLNTETFQKLLLKHFREKIKIEANGVGTIQLKNGKIILGHQTDVRFDIMGMPEILKSLDLQHLGFGTLRDHYCILKIITREHNSQNFILQKENNFSMSLEINNSGFAERPKINFKNWIVLGIVCIAILSLLFVLYRAAKGKYLTKKLV